jgi:SAM-dependent methyltransferase
LPAPTDPFADNLETWEAWTKIHVDSKFYDVGSFVDGSNPIRLRDYELADVGDVSGKTLLHTQCHFGLDTLSWARVGALATGIDFSPSAVAAARALAEQIGDTTTRFVQSDVYSLPANLEGQFDVVYTSRGVLGWLPDISRWASVAAHFVRPGGFLYVAEAHPVSLVFDDEAPPPELRLRYPYWEHTEPLTFEVKGSYADRGAPTPRLTEHGWDHSLGEIVTAVADAGLRIDFVHEFDFAEWDLGYTVEAEDGKWRIPGPQGCLPLFFTLKATKPA